MCLSRAKSKLFWARKLCKNRWAEASELRKSYRLAESGLLGKIRCVAAVESVFSRSSELSEAYGLPVVENPVLSSVRAVLLWYTVSRRYVRTVQEVHFLRKASRVHWCENPKMNFDKVGQQSVKLSVCPRAMLFSWAERRTTWKKPKSIVIAKW